MRLDDCAQFNNAGIMHPKDDNALNTEEKIWDLTMQINVKGVWWGCKYAILAMRENKADPEKGLTQGGSIINTASFVAIMGAATPQLACNAVVFFPKETPLTIPAQILPRRLVHEVANASRTDTGVGCRARDDQGTRCGPCS